MSDIKSGLVFVQTSGRYSVTAKTAHDVRATN